jgi:hypothetical protein
MPGIKVLRLITFFEIIQRDEEVVGCKIQDTYLSDTKIESEKSAQVSQCRSQYLRPHGKDYRIERRRRRI